MSNSVGDQTNSFKLEERIAALEKRMTAVEDNLKQIFELMSLQVKRDSLGPRKESINLNPQPFDRSLHFSSLSYPKCPSAQPHVHCPPCILQHNVLPHHSPPHIYPQPQFPQNPPSPRDEEAHVAERSPKAKRPKMVSQNLTSLQHEKLVVEPVPMLYGEIFKVLVQKGEITPKRARPVGDNPPRWFKANEKCEYHMGAPGHNIENCWALKNQVQKLRNAGILKFEDEDKPDVTKNPLPNHGA